MDYTCGNSKDSEYNTSCDLQKLFDSPKVDSSVRMRHPVRQENPDPKTTQWAASCMLPSWEVLAHSRLPWQQRCTRRYNLLNVRVPRSGVCACGAPCSGLYPHVWDCMNVVPQAQDFVDYNPHMWDYMWCPSLGLFKSGAACYGR